MLQPAPTRTTSPGVAKNTGPFGLIFFGPLDDLDTVVSLLEPGGFLAKDDLTPGRPGPDPVREALFGHPRLVAAEVQVVPEMTAIVAVRR